MADAGYSRPLHGPYEPPACRVGDVLTCAIRGRVKVVGFSAGPIPWPLTALPAGGGFRFHVVCGDLLRALRRETAPAIVPAWGVSPSTVVRWRRALHNRAYRARLRRAYHAGPVQARIGTQHTAAARAQMSESHRRTCDRRRVTVHGWQAAWDALLGTMPDAALAARLGVTQAIVYRRRHALGVACHGPSRPTGHRRGSSP
jgi:hypothetical protein